MRTIVLILLSIVCLLGSLKAQSSFEKTFYNIGNTFPDARCAIELSTNEYLIATGNSLIKTDINGNILASVKTNLFVQTTYLSLSVPISIVELNNGNYLVAGDGWLVVDPNLQPINLPGHNDPWNHINYQNGTTIRSVTKKNNGEIAMTGYSDFLGQGVPFPTLTILNPDGTLQSHRQLRHGCIVTQPFPPTTLFALHTEVVKATNDGGVILIGANVECPLSSLGAVNFFIIKFDQNNNIMWQKYYGSAYNDEPSDIIELSTGGYMVSGHFNGTAPYNGACIMKIDNNGNLQWTRSYVKPNTNPFPNFASANALVEKNANEVLFVGFSREDLGNSQIDEPFLVNINVNNGSINSSNFYPNWAFPHTIIKSNNGNNFIISADPASINLNAAVSNCQAISPVNDPLLNLKEVALIGLNQRINNNTLSAQEMSSLQNLAAQCPYTDGIAVFQARAILSEIDTNIYFNSCESYYAGNSSRLANESKPFGHTNSEINIYPNPTNNILHIDTDEKLREIKILTVTGKVVKSVLPNSNTIHTTDLPIGIYLIQITTDKQSFSEKIIKLN